MTLARLALRAASAPAAGMVLAPRSATVRHDLWRLGVGFGAMLMAACAPPPPSAPKAPAAAAGALPVALVVDGSAATRPGAAASVATVLGDATGRRVVMGTRDPAANAALPQLAERLAHQHKGMARYDWREPRCPMQTAAAVAAAAPVAAVYHVTLDVTDHTRPAEPVDAARGVRQSWTPRETLQDLGIGGPRLVDEERIHGTITMTTFTGDKQPAPAPVAFVAFHRAPVSDRERADLGVVVRDPLKTLPPPREPHWDVAAGHLVSGGCPFLGLAVYDARVRHVRAGDRLVKTAVAAMSRHATRRVAHRAKRKATATAAR